MDLIITILPVVTKELPISPRRYYELNTITRYYTYLSMRRSKQEGRDFTAQVLLYIEEPPATTQTPLNSQFEELWINRAMYYVVFWDISRSLHPEHGGSTRITKCNTTMISIYGYSFL